MALSGPTARGPRTSDLNAGRRKRELPQGSRLLAALLHKLDTERRRASGLGSRLEAIYLLTRSLRGLDLNQRPLGYEFDSGGCVYCDPAFPWRFLLRVLDPRFPQNCS